MKIIWTHQAKYYLQQIVKYYIDVASARVAENIRNKILNAPKNLLINHPQLGVKEPNLPNEEVHSLITGHYKILYQIEPKAIYILDVFDTRQNPSKMGRSID